MNECEAHTVVPDAAHNACDCSGNVSCDDDREHLPGIDRHCLHVRADRVGLLASCDGGAIVSSVRLKLVLRGSLSFLATL